MKGLIILTMCLTAGLSAGATKDKWDSDRSQWTPMMVFAYENNIKELSRLINLKQDVNEKNAEGITALIIAVKKGNDRAVKLLLDNFADPNLADSDGITPLMYAAMCNEYHVAKHLIKSNADVNGNRRNYSVLMGATAFGSMKLMKLIIKSGADINAGDATHLKTALSLAEHDQYKGHYYYRKVRMLKRWGAVN